MHLANSKKRLNGFKHWLHLNWTPIVLNAQNSFKHLIILKIQKNKNIEIYMWLGHVNPIPYNHFLNLSNPTNNKQFKNDLWVSNQALDFLDSSKIITQSKEGGMCVWGWRKIDIIYLFFKNNLTEYLISIMFC